MITGTKKSFEQLLDLRINALLSSPEFRVMVQELKCVLHLACKYVGPVSPHNHHTHPH